MQRPSVKALLLLLLAIIPSILAQETCSSFINKLQENQNNPTTWTPEMKDYFAFSGQEGQGKNAFGNKTACSSNPNRKFFMIGEIKYAWPRLYSDGWNQVHETGVCLPYFCQKEVLGSNYPELLNLCQINGWTPEEKTLVLYDPNGPPPRDGGFYTIVAIIIALAVLCLIATVAQNKPQVLKLSKEKSSHWLLKSFDAVANLKSLNKTAKESGQSDHLAMFGFVRFFSVIRIIGYHSVGFNQRTLFSNGLWPTSIPWIVQFFLGGFTSVGQFFFMGGFLAAFTLIGKASREGVGKQKFLSDMLHRLFKIYPGFWTCILLFWFLLPGVTNGTLWNRQLGDVSICAHDLPQNIFLVDGFFSHPFGYCSHWTWYISLDFQVYPIVILIAYIYAVKGREMGYKATKILTLLSLFSAAIIIAFVNKTNKSGWDRYPHPRAYEILIGVFFGIQYYEYSKLKRKDNFNAYCEEYASLRYLSIVAGLVLNFFAIFYEYEDTFLIMNHWEYLRRVMVSIGTPLVLVPLANDCTSILKKFMNLRIFQSLGKLCFGLYLFHYHFLLIIRYTKESYVEPYNLSFMMFELLRVTIYTLIVAFIYHLLLEKPLLNIEAHFQKGKKNIKPASAATTAPLAVDAFAKGKSYELFKDESDRSPAMDNKSTKDEEQSNQETSTQDIEIANVKGRA